jgi:hypothetical protein
MTLQDLIDGLKKLNPATIAPRGFHNPHSWRGVYAELAFEPTEGPVTVGEMLATAESALGQTYEGWKGGDFTMNGHTDVHIDYEGQYGGADVMELWFAALAPAPAPATCIVEAAADLENKRAPWAVNKEWLDSLRAAAQKAKADWNTNIVGWHPASNLVSLHGLDEVDAAYVAAARPDTILALLDAARASSSLGGEAGGGEALKERVEVAEARVKVMQADVAKQVQAARLDIAREIYRAVMREASEDVRGEDNEFKQGIAHERRLIHKWASERFPGPTQEEKDQFDAS